MMQIGVIGLSRTLTGSRLVTKPIIAKSVISQAGNSRACRPPNKKIHGCKKLTVWALSCPLDSISISIQQSFGQSGTMSETSDYSLASVSLVRLTPINMEPNYTTKNQNIWNHIKSDWFGTESRVTDNPEWIGHCYAGMRFPWIWVECYMDVNMSSYRTSRSS